LNIESIHFHSSETLPRFEGIYLYFSLSFKRFGAG